MKIYYWCPYLTNIATIKSVLRSAKSLSENNKTKNLRKNYNCFSAVVPDSQWQKQCNKQYLKSFKNYKPNMAFPNK